MKTEGMNLIHKSCQDKISRLEKTITQLQEKIVKSGFGANSLDADVSLSIDLLMELMYVCKPYRSRKKGTPRADCSKLNKVYTKCEDFIETTKAT